jgi:hypothetical protein
MHTHRPKPTFRSPETNPTIPWSLVLNIPRPLLTLRNPAIHRPTVPNPQANLERLTIHRKSIRHLVAAETVQDRLIAGFLGW